MMLWVHMPEMKSVFMKIRRQTPIQAALSSAASFSFGAFFPMLAILFSPEHLIMPSVLITGIAALAILGALSSYFAGTSKIKGSLRIILWGILAMAFSSWIGSLFNVIFIREFLK